MLSMFCRSQALGVKKHLPKKKRKIENAVINYGFFTSNTFSFCKMAKFFIFIKAWKTIRQATSYLQWLLLLVPYCCLLTLGETMGVFSVFYVL